MRARRSPSYPNTADADAFSADLSVSDLPDMIDPDAEALPRGKSRDAGPLVVCLACGSSPSGASDCRHDEVARIDSAPSALRAAAQRLAQAAQEKRALERALRKLVSAEVSSGAATLETTPEPPPVVVQLPPTSALCPRCAEEAPLPKAPPPPLRAPRRKSPEEQGFFGFAAPPPPPPEPVVEDPAPTPDTTPLDASDEAPKPPKAPKTPRKKKPAPAPEPAPEPAETP